MADQPASAGVIASVRNFARFTGQHAAFLGVVGASLAAIATGAWYTSSVISGYKAEIALIKEHHKTLEAKTKEEVAQVQSSVSQLSICLFSAFLDTPVILFSKLPCLTPSRLASSQLTSRWCRRCAPSTMLSSWTSGTTEILRLIVGHCSTPGTFPMVEATSPAWGQTVAVAVAYCQAGQQGHQRTALV